MNSATIKVFLPFGDPKRLRTAEISNWSGKAVAAPRTDLEGLLEREELQKAGVYVLTGTAPDDGMPMGYIGEAEVIRERLRVHKAKDFWVQAFVFVSKDENLTKSHVRYLEGRLIADAIKGQRFRLDNSQSSGSKLPESDREDMEVFLDRVRQLLPVLGTDILTPLAPKTVGSGKELICTVKGATARGERTETGFVVFAGSQAVSQERPSAIQSPFVISLRSKLREEGVLVPDGDHLKFSRNTEFSSPSAAAAVVCGGSANGLVSWKIKGKTLKEIEADE